MRWMIALGCAVLVTSVSAAPSAADKERTAKVTCAILAETRAMDSALRVERVNDAREELRLEPYLEGDDYIVEAIQYGVCELLVLDRDWARELSSRKAAVAQLKAEREAERKQIEAKAAAEWKRMQAEKLELTRQKIAERGYAINLEDVVAQGGSAYLKPVEAPFTGTVKSFRDDGTLETSEEYVDGKQHGKTEWFYPNGSIELRSNYVLGKRQGVAEWFYRDGGVEYRREYDDDELVKTEVYDKNGNLIYTSGSN